MRITRSAFIGLMTVCGAFAARTAPAQDSWAYEVVPFLWASGIDGREGFKGQTVDVQADFEDLVDFVNIGAALRIAARRPPFGWFAGFGFRF